MESRARARQWRGSETIVQYASFLFASLLPLLPALDASYILLCGALYLFVVLWSGRRFEILTMPMALLTGVWFLSFFLIEKNTFLQSLPFGFSSILASDFITFRELPFFILIVLAGGMLSLWSREEEIRKKILQGFLVGASVAMVISVVQAILWLSPPLHHLALLFPNQVAPWNELGRPVGTFSDPNAFGLFAALCVPLWLTQIGESEQSTSRWWYGLMLLCTLVAGTLSGSRTFLLFLAVFFFTLLFFRKRSFLIVLGVVCLFGLFAALSLPAVERVSQSVSGMLSGDFHLLSNRLYFSEIAIRMFMDHPLVGVGPLHFQDLMTSYADFYEIPLGLWVDNPNNSYLGFLAEYGLFGVVFLLFMFSRIKLFPQQGSRVVLRSGMIAFLVVLLFGPHYMFIEISFTVAITLAILFRFEIEKKKHFLLFALPLLTFPLIFVAVQQSEYGLYHWERSPTGEYYRWSRGEFQSWGICLEGLATIHIRNGQPHPVTVMLTARGGNVHEEYSLLPAEQRRISVACGKYHAFRGITVHGEVSPLWQPVGSTDRRILGIQFFSQRPKGVLEAHQIDKTVH